MLPEIPILPQHAVEASYAAFVAGTKDLRAKDLTKLADTIDEEMSRTPPVCTPRVDEVAALLAKIGVRLYREDFSRGATGTFDACDYLGTASGFIRQAADALGATGLDAVAAAYQLLSIDRQPIGTGPYRLVSEDANGIHLEAWPGYHGGPAATRYLDFVPAKGDGSDLRRRHGRHLPERRLPRLRLPGVRRLARRPGRDAAGVRGTTPSRSTSGRAASSPTSTSGRRSSCASTCRATSTPRRPAPGRRSTAP